MKEIVVISGKGGTGKTSISASFAHLAGSEALVSDCDVDAANMHLLLDADFGTQEAFYSGETAHISKDLCTTCTKCQQVCRFDAIVNKEGFLHVDPLECEGCRYCSLICPQSAIQMQTQKRGVIYKSSINTHTSMVHARLGFGAENSGKLVAKVKALAKQKALKENKKYVISDGSPGIGCPVISSLSGANLVVLVSEASLSGLHDLKRVVALIKNFKLPAVGIINKADLNTKVSMQIKRFLHEQEINLIGSYLYDENFTKAMAEAKPITDFAPDSALARHIGASWGKIKNILTEEKQ